MRAWIVFLCGLACGLCVFPDATASGEESSVPYRLWWSFPRDDASAIEVDEADLHVSELGSRWELALGLSRCAPRRSSSAQAATTAAPGARPTAREVRVEALDADGQVRSTTRCVLPLKTWRTRFGARLVERLDDELDAHVSLLTPRHHPPAPARPNPE